MKATIGELITATEIAERAIGGLKHTVRDVNENLGSQLNSATDMSRQLTKLLAEGDGVLRRISRIAVAARPAEPEPPKLSAAQVDCRGGAGFLRPQKVRWPRRMKAFRDIRVIPVVLIAIFGLALLKVAGLVIDGGYVFDYQPKSTKRSWAQESFNFPGGKPDPVGYHRIGRGEKGRSASQARRERAGDRKAAGWHGVVSRSGSTGFGLGARAAGAAASAAAGAGSPRAGNRHQGKPFEVRGEADRGARSRN